MRINNSIRTARNFSPGLQVIMRICNDPETGASACLEDGHDSSPTQMQKLRPTQPEPSQNYGRAMKNLQMSEATLHPGVREHA